MVESCSCFSLKHFMSYVLPPAELNFSEIMNSLSCKGQCFLALGYNYMMKKNKWSIWYLMNFGWVSWFNCEASTWLVAIYKNLISKSEKLINVLGKVIRFHRLFIGKIILIITTVINWWKCFNVLTTLQVYLINILCKIKLLILYYK